MACVAASGNNGTSETHYPAANPNVIGVGALASDSWSLASYSSFGDDNVEVVAPGSAIAISLNDDGTCTYNIVQGTSIACPMVTAAVARYVSDHPHTEVSVVRELLDASSKDLGKEGRDSKYGYGALDLNTFLNGIVGIATFDVLTDEIPDEKRYFYEGHILQNVPDPDRENVEFGGWYFDDQLTEYFDNLSTPLEGNQRHEITLYAEWHNADSLSVFEETPLFGYLPADGVNPANGIEIISYSGTSKYVVVPEQIDSYTVIGIGESAFTDRSEIDGIQHGFLARIGERKRPISIKLPETLTYIANKAFYKNTTLVEIAIPDNVIAIGDGAFEECTALENVEFGEETRLKKLGRNAFAWCERLEFFHVGADVSEFSASVLFGDISMRSISVDSRNAYCALGDDKCVYSKGGRELVYRPQSLGGTYAAPSNVIAVGESALSFSKAEVVTLPEGLIHIDEMAFYSSSCLAINLPASLREIGDAAFAKSGLLSFDITSTSISALPAELLSESSVRNVFLPSSLESLGESCFASTSRLRSIDLSNTSVSEISMSCFASSGIDTIMFPKGLKKISDSAFLGALGLRDVTLPDSLESIGSYAFSGLLIDTISIPTNVRSIGKGAFSNCVRLSNVDFASDGQLRFIGESAFSRCPLTSFFVPALLEDIEEGALSECSQLSWISVHSDNMTYSSIDGVLFDKGRTTLVMYPCGRYQSGYQIPEGVSAVSAYAFSGARSLRNVIVPGSVSQVGAYSFSHASSLKSVELLNGVAFIGSSAFEYCEQLESLSIPASVQGIGRYAFYGDNRLSTITFAEDSKLNRIGFAAFAYCGIADVIVPSSVRTIGMYAFAGDTQLESLTFQAGAQITAIPYMMLQGCESLKRVDFGAGCTIAKINARTFSGLPSLEYVNASGCSNLKEIGNYCFYRSFALRQVELPEGLTDIGRYSFYACENLESITIPSTVSFIGRYAFTTDESVVRVMFASSSMPTLLQENWDYKIRGYYLGATSTLISEDWVYSELSDGTVAALEYSGNDETIDARTIAGKAVSVIGYGCFRGNSKARSIVLPNNLTTVCDYAFADCLVLESVNLPASVAYLGGHAFQDSNIGSVTFAPGSMCRGIGESAFEGTSCLNSVNIPSSVSKIGRRAFLHSSVKSVSFPEDSSLEEIGAYAFADSGIESISIPNSVRNIGDYAFYETGNLSLVSLGNPENLKIQSYAFYGCGVYSIDIPSGVSYIGELAFDACYNATSFKVAEGNRFYSDREGVLFTASRTTMVAYPAGRGGTVVIPREVSNIRFGAFERSAVESVQFEVGSSLEQIGYRAFANCASLKTVEGIPDSVAVIGRYAFSECSALTSIDLSKATNLGLIGDSAFYNCVTLSTALQMPNAVQEIGSKAFYGCSGLATAVTEEGSLRIIGAQAFAYTGIVGFDAPDTLECIGDEAFRGSSLRSLDLDNGVLLSIGGYAFAECDNLIIESLVIPSTVESIGENAFFGMDSLRYLEMPIVDDRYLTEYFGTRLSQLEALTINRGVSVPDSFAYWSAYLKNLKQVELPYGLVEIGSEAFRGCVNLNTLVLRDGLETIGRLAFCETGINEIEFPNTLKNIKYGAFIGCPFEELTFTDSVETIENGAFGGRYLKSVTFGSGLKSVSGFNDCSSLSQISFPEGLKYLSGFENSTAVTNVQLPSTLEEIGSRAFYRSGLTSVRLPDSLNTIGQDAFSYAKIQGYLYIPSGVQSISGAFVGCSGISWYDVDEENPYLLSSDGAIYSRDGKILYLIPKSRQGTLHVLEAAEIISQSAGEGCALTGLELPQSMRVIQEKAFYASKLREIKVADGLQSIGREAFAYTSLESIKLPSSLREIGQSAFEGSRLEEIVLPEGLEIIGSAAFYRTPITSIVLPSTLRKLPTNAFLYCGNLARIEILCEVNEIPEKFAYELGSLTEVIHPETIKTIRKDAFYGCTNLRSFDFNGVERIETGAFMLTALEDYVLPDSVVEVSGDAFFLKGSTVLHVTPDLKRLDYYHCYGDISTVFVEQGATLPKGNDGYYQRCSEFVADPNHEEYTSLNGVLYSKDLKTLIACPSGLTGRLSIPEGVEVIEHNAFVHTNLSSLELPSSIRTIKSAFGDSNQLCELVINSKDIEFSQYHGLFRSDELHYDMRQIGSFTAYYIGDYLVKCEGSGTVLEIPEGTVYVGNIPSSVVTLVLPDSVVTLNSFNTYDTYGKQLSLKTIVGGKGLKYINGPFRGAEITSLFYSTSLTVYSPFTNRLEVLEMGIGTHFQSGWTPEYPSTLRLVSLIADEGTSKEVSVSEIFHNIVAREVILQTADAGVRNVDLGGSTGFLIYSDEDRYSVPFDENWAEGNTVYYRNEWQLASFYVDDVKISISPLRTGAIVEAPSESEVLNAIRLRYPDSDLCSLRFLGWDIDGDGAVDQLPISLNEATGYLSAKAVYAVHDWQTQSLQDATCTQPGQVVKTCSTCGKVEHETFSATGHVFVLMSTVEPTDCEDGYSLHECSICGHVEQSDWVKATSCETFWRQIVAPTCDEWGTEGEFTPTGHMVKTRRIAPLDHLWDSGEIIIEPTCSRSGEVMQTCLNDSAHTRKQSVPAVEHDWSVWGTVAEADYAFSGLRSRTCRGCGLIDTEIIPKKVYAHTGGVYVYPTELQLYVGDASNVNAVLGSPDASNPRITWLSLDESVVKVDKFGRVIGLSTGTAEIRAIDTDGNVASCLVTVRDHDHVPGPVEKANQIDVSCEHEGSYDLVTSCSICGEALAIDHVVTASALPHSEHSVNAVSPTCEEAGFTSGWRCSVCGTIISGCETVPAIGHMCIQLSGSDPTCTNEGLSLGYQCVLCGKVTVAQDVIPALGHNWSEWVSEDSGIPTRVCAACGEREFGGVQTTYKVNYYFRDSGDLNYTKSDSYPTRLVFALSASMTNVQPDEIIGYSSKPVAQKRVEPDGSTEISVFYDRSKHDVCYMISYENEASEVFHTEYDVEYGSTLTQIDRDMHKFGYRFSGWSGMPETMPDEDVVVVGEYVRCLPDDETWSVNGDCQWRVDESGKLTVKLLNGLDSGYLNRMTWEGMEGIKHATFASGVRTKNCYRMFGNLSDLESVEIDNLDITECFSLYGMFSGCTSLTSVSFGDYATPLLRDLHALFAGCSSLQFVNWGDVDTSRVTDMSEMFAGCSSLQGVDVGGLNAASVTDMSEMFAGCSSLQSVDVGGLNTASVTDMSGMFRGCSSLTAIDLSRNSLSCVRNMEGMFYYCSKLQEVNLPNLRDIERMRSMFEYCSNVISVSFSAESSLRVDDAYHMFSGCRKLKTADLSAFDSKRITCLSGLFRDCDYLSELILPGGMSFAYYASSYELDRIGLSGYWLDPDGDMLFWRDVFGACENFSSGPVRFVSRAAACSVFGHAWGEWADESAASCEADGTRVRHCSNDASHFETEAISATGHAWGEPSIVFSDDGRAATATWACANDASHVATRECSVTAEVTRAATCEAAGETTYTATAAGDASLGLAPGGLSAVRDDVPALGHDWGGWAVSDEASCESDGTAIRHCMNDASHFDTKAVPATGHAWGAWSVEAAASCEADGV